MPLGPWGQQAKEGLLGAEGQGQWKAEGRAQAAHARGTRLSPGLRAQCGGRADGAPWPCCWARYLFLFDKVVIVCKRRGYSYELKEVIELLFHKMTDDPMNNKDVKKVGPGLPGGEGRASEAGPRQARGRR